MVQNHEKLEFAKSRRSLNTSTPRLPYLSEAATDDSCHSPQSETTWNRTATNQTATGVCWVAERLIIILMINIITI